MKMKLFNFLLAERGSDRLYADSIGCQMEAVSK